MWCTPLGFKEKVVLSDKAGINTWVAKKGHSLRVIVRTFVYSECRRKYTKPEKSDVPLKADSTKWLTRSPTGGFDLNLIAFYILDLSPTEKKEFSVKIKKLTEQFQMLFWGDKMMSGPLES